MGKKKSESRLRRRKSCTNINEADWKEKPEQKSPMIGMMIIKREVEKENLRFELRRNIKYLFDLFALQGCDVFFI